MLWRECRVVRRAGVEGKKPKFQFLVVNFRGGDCEQLPGWSESINRNAYQVHSARLPEKIRTRYWCNQETKMLSPVHGNATVSLKTFDSPALWDHSRLQKGHWVFHNPVKLGQPSVRRALAPLTAGSRRAPAPHACSPASTTTANMSSNAIFNTKKKNVHIYVSRVDYAPNWKHIRT